MTLPSPTLVIVIPCYNEEDVLPITQSLFKAQLNELQAENLISSDSFILLVNDGSTDRTWSIIEDLAAKDKAFRGLSLSRNRGHQYALLAGLLEARTLGDISISIDCDGQDDINAMKKMVEKYHEGYDIVYGVRSSRQTDTFFKRTSAQTFYRLLECMGVEVVYNHADYRLLSRRALEALSEFGEYNIYLRGMVPLIGFKSTSVTYERHERMAGESHYPLNKMLALAADGITSLSIKPMRLITFFGLIVSLISFIGVIWAVVTSILGHSIAGWASLTSIICFLSGIQLLSIGVIGEYIGKMYLETKHRPRYVISKRTWASSN